MQLPIPFINRTKSLLGVEYPDFETALQQDPPVSIRLNTTKTQFGCKDFTPVPWASDAYYLSKRLSFTFDPSFHAGLYYVQEASSMFLEQVIKQHVHQPVRYLDLCAAPGGKTTQAISVLPQGSLVVANELVRQRANILAENVIKWGNPSVIVTNNDVADYSRLTHYFDVILTDVPCSGEGMFRKDEEAIQEWSVEDVEKCSYRQHRIIAGIWDALRPGGILIYSTCTYNLEENESMLRFMQENFDAEPLDVEIDSSWGITGALAGNAPAYRFFPHKIKGEGFFMAALRKPMQEYPYDRERLVKDVLGKKKGKSAKKETPLTFPEQAKGWLKDSDSYSFEMKGNDLKAYPSAYAKEFAMFHASMNVVHSGILLGAVKAKDIIPEHSLAMSLALNRDQFVSYELSWEEAIHFLRREAPALPEDFQKGFVLLTYKDSPLGWAKHIGNRSNNLYPQEWRIRSGYNPEEILLLL